MADSSHKNLSDIQKDGRELANQKRKQGLTFSTSILTSTVVNSGDKIPLCAVVIPLDWKIAARLEMVESARELITKSYVLGFLDHALPTILGAVIEGKGLYEYSVGEFFQLYGEFMGKYQVKEGSQTSDKMTALLAGQHEHMKDYVEYGKATPRPLPYAVRNILAHPSMTANTIEKGELRTSIELLRSWVNSAK